MESYYKDVRVYSANEFKLLQQDYKNKFGHDLIVYDRAESPYLNIFLRESCWVFSTLLTFTVIGLLTIYTSVLAGYVEQIPTIEEIILNISQGWILSLFPPQEKGFFNIQANCFSGTVSPCQLQLLEPFEVTQ